MVCCKKTENEAAMAVRDKIRDNFKKGSVEMLILLLLCEEDMYGYQLSQYIDERSGGALRVPEGTMYPSLYKLTANNYISDYKKQVGTRLTRVYYHIEPAGVERLRDMKREYDYVNNGILQVFQASKIKGFEAGGETDDE